MPSSSSPSPHRHLNQSNVSSSSPNNSHHHRDDNHQHHSLRSFSSIIRFRHGSPNNADHSSEEKRIPFSNLDPNFGNDEAVEEYIRLESGAVARDVTDRLTTKDLTERAKRLAALKQKHAQKKKVPVRSEDQVENYIQNMIKKGEERKRKHLVKIAKEMYPDPTPKISSRSRDLAQNYKAREEERKRAQQEKLLKQEKKNNSRRHFDANHNEGSLGHNSNNSSNNIDISTCSRAQKHHEIIQRRHDGTSFKPAGLVHPEPALFLTSGPSPRVASTSPHYRMTEDERKARFAELSQPREYQKSEKKK